MPNSKYDQDASKPYGRCLTYFNHLVPKGSRVRCSHPGGGYAFSHTTSDVWVMGHSPVVTVDGHLDAVSLLNITVINNGEMRS